MAKNYLDEVKPRKSIKLDRNTVMPFLYAIENPNGKNINYTNNTARVFHDGSAPTIGPGVSNESDAPRSWFTGKSISKNDIDDFAYEYFVHSDDVIRKAYDTRFGTKEYPNPSDTLSVGPRLYAAQNRYQMGFLGGGATGRDAILDAMAKGNANNLVTTIIKYGRKGDIDRMRRIKKARPNVYKKGGVVNTNKLSDAQYKSILRQVANENYLDWGETPESAYQMMLNDPGYDYRGYYNKYPNSRANSQIHWTDEFKGASHPTFSDESIYHGKVHPKFNPYGLNGGHWVGKGNYDMFMPPTWNSRYKIK